MYFTRQPPPAVSAPTLDTSCVWLSLYPLFIGIKAPRQNTSARFRSARMSRPRCSHQHCSKELMDCPPSSLSWCPHCRIGPAHLSGPIPADLFWLEEEQLEIRYCCPQHMQQDQGSHVPTCEVRRRKRALPRAFRLIDAVIFIALEQGIKHGFYYFSHPQFHKYRNQPGGYKQWNPLNDEHSPDWTVESFWAAFNCTIATQVFQCIVWKILKGETGTWCWCTRRLTNGS